MIVRSLSTEVYYERIKYQYLGITYDPVYLRASAHRRTAFRPGGTRRSRRGYLVDALDVANLDPLADVLADAAVTKVIHNAAFERSVFARFGIAIEPVVDTLALSRKLRGKVDGGHGLKAVCARELGIHLDRREQMSNWAQRPLSEGQKAYAAVAAEVLLALGAAFER